MEIGDLIYDIKIYLYQEGKFSGYSYFNEVQKLRNKHTSDYIIEKISIQLDKFDESYLNKFHKLHIKSLIRNYKLELLDI